MKMTKKTTFIALLLLVTTFNSYNMEHAAQRPAWLTQVGVELLSEAPSSPKTLENRIADLPEEIKDIIRGYLAMGANATSVQEASQAIKSLSLVNKELNQLINEPQFCLQTIKHLAKKFNCTDETAAIALNTKEALRRLKIQREALQSAASLQYGLEPLLLPQEVDANFTYGKSDVKVLLTTVFPVQPYFRRGLNANITNFIINLIERSKDVINYKDYRKREALLNYLRYISLARISSESPDYYHQDMLNTPEQKSYVLKIIEAFINAGVNQETLIDAKKEAEHIGDQDIINLIPNAIEQKHSTKEQG